MMHLALQVQCFEGKVRNGMEKGVVGVVLPSLKAIMNANDETTKHNKWLHHIGAMPLIKEKAR